MVIRRINPASLAKIAFIIYAIFGLIAGAFMTITGIAANGPSAFGHAGPFFSLFFGPLAIVILPIVYGCFGGAVAFLVALVYNAIAGKVGGIEIEVA
jgi:hypothetical protein